MNNKCLQRRKFLQTGVGVALAGTIPLRTIFAGRDQQTGLREHGSRSSQAKLQQIAQKYGSEFGQIKPEIKEG